MEKLIQKAEKEHCLSKEEVTFLLSDNSINTELFSAADRVRKTFVGDDVYLRALIEFSKFNFR